MPDSAPKIELLRSMGDTFSLGFKRTAVDVLFHTIVRITPGEQVGPVVLTSSEVAGDKGNGIPDHWPCEICAFHHMTQEVFELAVEKYKYERIEA